MVDMLLVSNFFSLSLTVYLSALPKISKRRNTNTDLWENNYISKNFYFYLSNIYIFHLYFLFVTGVYFLIFNKYLAPNNICKICNGKGAPIISHDSNFLSNEFYSMP